MPDSNSESQDQESPLELITTSWALARIHWDSDFRVEPIEHFDVNDPKHCVFIFKFDDSGKLTVKFNKWKFNGDYLLEGNKFIKLNIGYQEKEPWTRTPECVTTPEQLSFAIPYEPDYSIAGDTLYIENSTDKLVLVKQR